MRSSPARLPSRAARALAAVAALAVLAGCQSSEPTAPIAPSGDVSLARGGKTKVYSQVFSAYGRSCSILLDGIARCWGYNEEGELGDGTTTNRLTSAPVSGGIDFASLSLADFESCGLSTAGKAYCWGANYADDPLGIGTTVDQLTPAPVLGNDVFIQLASGVLHHCGLLADGTIKCWGSYTNGPQPVTGPAFTSITHGAIHACGLTSAGDAYCWASYSGADFGQLGTGPAGWVYTPTPVVGGIKFTKIEAGYSHTCGLDDRGRAYCWGSNYIGQLGDNSQTDRQVPTPVATSLRFTEIRGGNSHTCALTRQGDAYCWGNGYAGQLGDGTFRRDSIPVRVTGGIKFQSIASASSAQCGVSRENALYCWGWNFGGALGDGTTTDRAVPAPVTQ